MKILFSRIGPLFHDTNPVAHGGVVTDECRSTTLYCIQSSFDLSRIISILHFNNLPPRGFGNRCEVGCNGFRGHVTQLNIIPISMHDKMIELQVCRKTECLNDLPFLAIAIRKKNINKSTFLQMLQPKRRSHSIAYTFSKRTRSKRNVADAGFCMTGKSVRRAKCVNNRLRTLQTQIVPFPTKEPLQTIGQNRKMPCTHPKRLIHRRIAHPPK